MNTPALVPNAALHATATPRAPIDIAIDRIVLDGVGSPRGGERALRGALESELARLFAGATLAGALRSGGSLRQLSLAALPLPQELQADWLGRQLARALHAGING